MLRCRWIQFCGVLLFFASVPLISGAVDEPDFKFLTEGVEGIGPSGVPGPLCVFDNAATILAGREGNTLAPVLAAAKFGKGRVIAFGHDGYLGDEPFLTSDGTRRLAVNIFRWLTAENGGTRIGVLRNPRFADFITTLCSDVHKLDNLADANLDEFQVLVIHGAQLPLDQIERVSQFVSGGGGLYTASLGWGWLQISGKTDLKTEHPGNLLLAPMGIVWADGYLATTSRTGGIFAISADGPPKLLNVTEALAAINDHENGLKTIEPPQIAQAVATVERGIRSIPQEQSAVFGSLKQFLDREVIPSPDNRIRKDRISDVLAIGMQTQKYLIEQKGEGTSLEGIPTLAAGSDFPGPVPGDAKIVSKNIEIDTRITDWHSTGLYAAPGSVVTVTLPADFTSPQGAALSVRIGCHSDHLWGLTEWQRFPEITTEIPCQSEITKAVNPFGGLVYLVVPRNFNRGKISVQIDGCVEAPLFVYGETSLEEWKNVIRNAPVPWGELASDRVILSLPSQHLRELDDPDKVMEFWNKILDDDADLCGRPLERNRPERIVCDRQISAGYMHAGYPIMTHLDVEKEFVNLRNNQSTVGGWGFFHELGHNHQSGDWTFDGTGEVTVNLFTLYNFHQLGVDRATAHPEQKPERRERKRNDHFAAGSPFDKWKSDPFLALIMYTDIIDEFGWEPLKAVFREYRDLRNNERPRNDAEKRDQWMVRLSRQLDKNLGPYFDRWGVPVSQSAKDSIKELPEWMPY